MKSSEKKIVDQALRIIEKYMKKGGNKLTSPVLVREFLRLKMEFLEHEVFSVLFLDNQHRLIECREMFAGTIDGASVYPREVVKAALSLNAAAVIFSHNHPSGVAEPSQADRRITQRLVEALKLVDIRVLDHLIVGSGDIYSFAETGLM